MPTKLTKRSRPRQSVASTDSLVLVVPTKRRVRHLMREIVWASKSGETGIPIHTLESLALSIWQAMFPNMRAIGEPILTLLFDQAISASRDVLHYFDLRGGRSQLPRGTFERIVHVIRKLKETGIYTERLREELDQCELGEESKLEDVLTIYQAYEKSLAGLDAADTEAIVRALHQDCSQHQFVASFRKLFPQVTEISINGFDEFTEPELGFIAKLCQVGADVSVVFDFQRGNTPLFGHLEENFRRLLEFGLSVSEEEEFSNTGKAQLSLFNDSGESAAGVHRWIATNLFKRSLPESQKKLSRAITVVRSKDRRAEVELICKIIKQLFAENSHFDPSRI